MDFSVPPPNMRGDPGGQTKFANLNYNYRHPLDHPRPSGAKLTAPQHIRNLNFNQNNQIMMQPPSYGLIPQPLAGPQYRAVQPQYGYQGVPPVAMYPAPAYQYHPPAPARFPQASPPGYQVIGAPPPARPPNNNIPAFPVQPPPGFTRPQSQPGLYLCPPPLPPPPPTPVIMPAAPSMSNSDIPDLRHQFLTTQFVGKPGQVIFLPPMPADKSVQTIQVMTPVTDPSQAPGQFSVQTIVLPIMKVDNTNNPINCHQQQVSPPEQQVQVPALPVPTDPAPDPVVEEGEDVMLNQLDGTGLPKVMQGIDLDQVKQFAAEFKAARQSLGLTQTQVGQALNSSVARGEEGISVSQSTICRFEKLEITALQVKKLLPALRAWLDWVKERQRQGLPVLVTEDTNRDIKKRKKRTVFNKESQTVLSEEFDRNQSPSSTQLSEIADRLGMERETGLQYSQMIDMNIPRIVLKGTSKLTLHERFTQLSKIQGPNTDHDAELSVRTVTGVSGRLRRGASSERPTRLPYSPRKAERDLQLGPSPAVSAAARIKRRSIRQRLGVKARLSLPRRSWYSQESPFDSRDYENNRNRSRGYLNRGGFGGWPRFRNRGQWMPGRKNGGRWRGGRGRGRGQGRGRGGRDAAPPSREQLDKELESYMAGTRNVLDKQLDDYMMEFKSTDS